MTSELIGRRVRPSEAVFLVAAAAVVAVILAVTGGKASASHVGCGAVITTDTRLDSDLLNCPNNGIVIGADNVTLNLNDHLIDGDGTPAVGCDPDTEFCDVGVLNRGHDGVTVVHGSVREFNVGVWGLRVSHNRLLGISSSGNQCCGLGFFRATRSLVRNSSGSGSGEGGNGMFLFESRQVRILDNAFRHDPVGLHVDGSTDTLIQGNRFVRDREAIDVTGNRNQVRRNRFVRDREAIDVTGNRNVIARNRASRGLVGVWILNGRGNLVAHNVVVGARRAGIRLGIGTPSIGGANNVVRRNLVRGGGGDGFLVNQKDEHSVLRRNVAVGAEDDGFDVRSRTPKLTRNRAFRNRDLGIQAVRGVIDGGGNIARYNGDPRQCVNVKCH